MGDISIKLKSLEIRSKDDFPRWASESTDIVVFPADHDIRLYPEDYYEAPKIEFELEGDEYWLKFVEHPLCDISEELYSDLAPVNDSILRGSLVIFLLDPDNNISLVTSKIFGRNLFYRLIEQSRIDLARNYDLSLSDSTQVADAKGAKRMVLPIAVGYSLKEGANFKHKSGGKYIRWTRNWALTADPLLDKLHDISLKIKVPPFARNVGAYRKLLYLYDMLLTWIFIRFPGGFGDKYYKDKISEAISFWENISRKQLKEADSFSEDTLEDVHDRYREIPVVKAHLLMPARPMRSFLVASESFERSPDFIVLDKDSAGWPVAVARKFGDGAVAYLPASIDMDDLMKRLKSIHEATPDARGWQMVKMLVKMKMPSLPKPLRALKQDESQSDTKDEEDKPLLKIIDPPKGKNKPSTPLMEIKTSFDGGKELHIPIDKFIQFLIIWYYSVRGEGIMFCSDDIWKSQIKEDKKYSKIMGMKTDDSYFVHLDTLFPVKTRKKDKKKDERSAYFNRIVSKMLYGIQRWKKEQHLLIGKVLVKDKKKLSETISYSTRRLNLKLEIPDTVLRPIQAYMRKNPIILKTIGEKTIADLKSAIESQ